MIAAANAIPLDILHRLSLASKSKDFWTVIGAAIGLPFIFLVIEYFRRFVDGKETLDYVIGLLGTDSCILAMGATGAVFIDSHVRSAPLIGSQPYAVIVVAMLVGARICCNLPRRVPSLISKHWEFKCGLFSMMLVITTIFAGYLETVTQ